MVRNTLPQTRRLWSTLASALGTALGGAFRSGSQLSEDGSCLTGWKGEGRSNPHLSFKLRKHGSQSPICQVQSVFSEQPAQSRLTARRKQKRHRWLTTAMAKLPVQRDRTDGKSILQSYGITVPPGRMLTRIFLKSPA